MKILWLTWKDRDHPLAGGAEVVNEALASRLAHDGHEVTFLVASTGSPQVAGLNGADTTERNGFKIIRVGGRFSVYWCAYRYYKKRLQNWPDLVIDEMNTMPFFAQFYVKKSQDTSYKVQGTSGKPDQKPKVILFVHQLAREIWFYQMPFPISLIGYLLEPVYLFLLATFNFDLVPVSVVTVSNSTKQDLIRYGFQPERIRVISEGIEMTPLPDLSAFNLKLETLNSPVLLAFGAIRAMKRTLDCIQAFELLKEQLPHARLIIAGAPDDSYGRRVLSYMNSSRYASDIEYMGSVPPDRKAELMQKCHVLLVTSVREGWGLVVTEANSQGTPAVVYDVPGLRDSVQNGKTGLVTGKNTPHNLADSTADLLCDREGYARIREVAWRWSKEINFETAYRQFLEVIQKT